MRWYRSQGITLQILKSSLVSDKTYTKKEMLQLRKAFCHEHANLIRCDRKLIYID